MRRFFGTLALSLFLTCPTYSQTTEIWRIGNYDQSSLEFHAAARDHVRYQVGTSDWKRDWPGAQNTGSSYAIEFSLPNTPSGTFSLKISTLTYSPGVPALEIDVNGHEGIYYLHPKLSYYLGDQRSIFDPGYSSYAFTVDLPPEFMKVGDNTILLSAVAQHHSFVQQDNSSSLHYDAISLSNNPLDTFKPGVAGVVVTPTIFFRRKSGGLSEVVEAYIRFRGPAPDESATLQLQQRKYVERIQKQEDFGEQRIEFEIPEWQGTTPARLIVGDGGAAASFDLSLTASRKWTLFVVPHTHVDIGYTDYQGKVAEAQARTLDEAMNLIDQHPAFRFATDGSWNVEQFLTTRSPEDREKFLRFVQNNKIGVPAQYVNLLTGYASLETIYRSLYYSKGLSLKYKTPFAYANTTDVPTYTGDYPSILASAGIRYWAAGGNNDRAPILSYEPWNEKSPFWWKGPDGKKVLFWYSRCYEQIMFLFGLPPHQSAIYETLPIFLQAYDKPEYKPNAVLIYGAQQENTDLYPGIASFATDWNEKFVYPKLQYSTFQDFFQYIDRHFGNELATYQGDMGPYWEDGIGSDAYYAAEDRQNQSNALSAEILSTISHNVSPYLHPPKDELDDVWRDIELFAEHTWTGGNSIRQPDSEEATKQLAVKDNRATQARFKIEDLKNRAMDELADQIRIPSSTLVVFNALNWKRDALLEIDLEKNDELEDLSTNRSVSVQVLTESEGFRHVRFMASDLPPVGYKCFRIHPGPAPVSSYEPEASRNTVIENRYYRITVDPDSGAIKSIFDKQLARELVDANSPYRFGQYLYVTGGDGNTRLINPFKALPLPQLTIHPSGNGQYLGTQKTPWGSSIELRSSDTNTPAIHLEILLFDTQKKIEFRYRVEKNYTTAKEGVYFAFPVATPSPQFVYATQQGWVNPAKDMFKGACLEWFTIQKWMAVHDANLTVGIVPIDAPLASFGDIDRGEWPGEFHPKSSSLFSYAMNNYWHTNYRAGQGGSVTFRYVLTSAAHFDPAALTRLGWESMESPELDNVIQQDKVGDPARPLPAEGRSFLNISAPNVVLVTWKLAEDGDGTILRLQEIGARETEATLKFSGKTIQSAKLCNSVEDDLRSLDIKGNALQLSFHPHEVMTIRLKP